MKVLLQNYLGNPFLYHLVMAGVLFITTLALGWILKRLLNTFGRKLISKTDTELDDLILAVILDSIKWVAIVAGSYLASEELYKATTREDVMARQLLGYAQGIIFVAFVFVVTVVVIRIADTVIRHTMEAHAKRTSSTFNEALLPLTHRLINIVIGLIAIIIVLNHFGQDVSSLVVSLGVGSLAIALAAQDTLANMIAGFVIIMDRPFRVNDRIQLPSGELGDVHEIGIRSTKILDFDNNLIIIPNAELIKSRITNYSYPQELVRVIVDVGVAYGTQLDLPKLIMTELAKHHPDVLKDPIPEVFTIDLADSSINLRLVCRTDDYRKKFKTETTLREQIYDAFLKERVQIPFPQRVVHIHNANGKSQDPQKRKTVRRKGV